MKLSTFAIALTLSVAATQSFAKDIVLKPLNDNIETQACLTAAKEGFGPALRLIRLTCTKTTRRLKTQKLWHLLLRTKT